jgi:hypothetical protein
MSESKKQFEDMNNQMSNKKTPEAKAAKAELDKLISGGMNYMAHHISGLIEKIIAETGLNTPEEREKSEFVRGLSVAQQIAKAQVRAN